MNVIRVPAIRINQGVGREVFSFAVDGKLLHRFAAVSRVRRTDEAKVQGYQRPEVLTHVKSIRNYLESPTAMIPNSLVVAFDDRVVFEPSGSNGHDGTGDHGVLVIPTSETAEDADKPGWIVDGQQRAAALRDARVSSFPIFISGFVATSEADQRSQFILVNSTKPLPKGLIYELLPTTEGQLPAILRRKRFPAYLLERLNFDEDSPLRLKIRTPTQPDGIIKDNSILKMVDSSMTDGALYRFRDPNTGEGDTEAMLDMIKAYWDAVRTVFWDAWDMPPRRSRLMHGVGISSLGFLMDAMAEGIQAHRAALTLHFVERLELIRPNCAWCSGYWEVGDGSRRKWNDFQNTSRDQQVLGSFLVATYAARARESGLGA